MLVQHDLETAARLTPDRFALICGERRLTYRELDLGANRLAHALLEGGVAHGDRVAILLENSPEAVIAIFGALKAGAVFTMVHPATKRARLSALLHDAEPAALITDRARAIEAVDVVPEISTLRLLVWADDAPVEIAGVHQSLCWSELQSHPPERPICPSIDVDLGALIYTSGTTGDPKGVMCAHQNMVAATRSVNAYLRTRPDDVILNVLPLAFSYGLYQLFLAFQVGASVALETGFGFPSRLIDLMARERVTMLPGVPTLFALLLRFPDLLRRELPALRVITNAAGPLPMSHLAQIRAAYPGASFFSMYGQTECKRISFLPPEELNHRPSSVGIAIPNSDVYVAGDDGERLPAGEIGELVVRGAHVMRGYWRAPELTAKRFQPLPTGETVLHTGDLFRMDEDGFLYYVSRTDDIIKSRGEKVAPAEIENVVCQLEQVVEAAAVGVPDPILGQAVYLAVVARSGAALTVRDIVVHCARLLDEVRRPKHVELVEELPRTANGKIDKRSLSLAVAACAAS